MMSVLLTRPFPQSQRFAALLRTFIDAEQIVISPLLRIEPLAVFADAADGMIFTSANGAELAPKGQGRVAYCVGQATAQSAQAKGYVPISTNGNAHDLIQRILEDRPQGRLLHLRGEVVRVDIAAELRSAGITAAEQISYRQVAMGLTPDAKLLLNGEKPVILPLFSPRTVRILLDDTVLNAPLRIAALSQAIADTVENVTLDRLEIAQNPSASAMVEAVKRLMDAGTRLEDANNRT